MSSYLQPSILKKSYDDFFHKDRLRSDLIKFTTKLIPPICELIAQISISSIKKGIYVKDGSTSDHKNVSREDG